MCTALELARGGGGAKTKVQSHRLPLRLHLAASRADNSGSLISGLRMQGDPLAQPRFAPYLCFGCRAGED
jgi:hypothetical protein